MKRILLIAVCVALWIIPVKLAHGHELGEQPFINYAQFHKKPETVANPQKPVQVSTKRVSTSQVANNQGVYNGRHYSKEEVIQLIKDYSNAYGIQSEAPLCIAKAESGYNQQAKNKSSSASGVFQYLASTWRGTDEGRAGLSVFDADANVRAAIKYMASRRSTQPWEVRHKCPSIKPI